MPAKTPAAALLLLPGSGPTDRDGNQAPAVVTDLLKELAEKLTKEGYATFRFDKRATPRYSGMWPKDVSKLSAFFGWDRFTSDARAALTFLQKQPGVDATRTGIIGHSEGSGLGIQIGKDTVGKPGAPKVLVLMGSPGRPLAPIIREQLSQSLGRANASSEMIKEYMDYTEAALKQVRGKGTFPPKPPSGLIGLFHPSSAALVRAYVTIDPAQNLKSFKGPVLVLQGGKDIQISVRRDTPLLEKALKARGGKYEIFVVPSASHNFKLVIDPAKESGFSGPIADTAIEKLTTWLKANL